MNAPGGAHVRLTPLTHGGACRCSRLPAPLVARAPQAVESILALFHPHSFEHAKRAGARDGWLNAAALP